MNFGALNSPGGEKRLNVAITRARRELHVFSSIRAEQIDLERTRAVGVRDLKAFLDYAERGSIALPSRDEGSLGPAENAFEEAVAEAFRAKGWEVRTQIGVSGFRVDLGVVHPDHAGGYLVGIECDGVQYHSSATARDRDKVRQAVLEGLGWTILRIWSTDWFRNPGSVAERVHTELERLLEQDRTGRESREAEVEARTTEYDGDRDGGSHDEQPALPVPKQDPELLSAGSESASDEEIEPPAINGQDEEIELNLAHSRTHLVADAVATSRPVPLAELENGNRENDGPETKKRDSDD